MLNRQGRKPVTPVGGTAAFDNAVQSLKRKKKKRRSKQKCIYRILGVWNPPLCITLGRNSTGQNILFSDCS